MNTQAISSLEDIWPRQAELNARAGFDTQALGSALLQAEGGGDPPPAGVRLQVGRALKCYVDALLAECHELHECLAWKHWYREAHEGRQYQLQDIQNARVEAIDMLFFWISICQLLGLTPAEVYRLYQAKLTINHRRQDDAARHATRGALWSAVPMYTGTLASGGSLSCEPKRCRRPVGARHRTPYAGPWLSEDNAARRATKPASNTVARPTYC